MRVARGTTRLRVARGVPKAGVERLAVRGEEGANVTQRKDLKAARTARPCLHGPKVSNSND